jgi:tRNA-dihydrouridine synthase A
MTQGQTTQGPPTTRATPHPVSIAPMMQRTDRHFRFLMRCISRHVLLYTEMVTTGAIIHGDRRDLLEFSDAEHPIAVQLGGDDPEALTECARIAQDMGYDEVNINVGCPSDRVQKGSFGVSLMARPERVAEAVQAMRAAVKIPVSVKHRIGFDNTDSYEDMARFVSIVADAGCDRFTVHARKAWLKGLSPKQNRNVPPLRYEDVHRLKRERPDLLIEINGGLRTLDGIAAQLEHCDGVMIGRAAYDDPWLFATVDSRFYGAQDPIHDRAAIVEAMLPYVDKHVRDGGRLHAVTRHMHMLFSGQSGGKVWRRHLSEYGIPAEANGDVVRDALEKLRHVAAQVAERRAQRDQNQQPGAGEVRPLKIG